MVASRPLKRWMHLQQRARGICGSFARRFRLRRALGHFLSLESELSRLASDVEAILVCSGQGGAISAGEHTALRIRQDLRTMADAPLGARLARMREMVDWLAHQAEGFHRG